MLEHNCDECGKSNLLNCLCPDHLSVIQQKAFDDGFIEGETQGFNKAKEELNGKE